MELQPSDSLKIIQEIIQQRKQKYEANGFFLLFWGALIALSGIVALLSFCMPFSLWNHYEIALLTIYFPFAFVALAVALHLKMRLWVATSLIAIVIIYSVLYCQYGVYLPLLSSVLACLLFLIPGVQLYIHYKKQQNV